MTQDELAQLIKKNRGTIASWENNLTKPSLESLFSLSDALNVDTQWLDEGFDLDSCIGGKPPVWLVDEFRAWGEEKKAKWAHMMDSQQPISFAERTESIVNMSPAQKLLFNVMLDVDATKLTDDEAVHVALAIQEALRKAKP